ncbi:MAG: hypothetical protein Q8O26_17535 [Phreatobacter sp.]|uniref:hypothetical protein n=1 Tax=Phreatobacter sp. TaxID=1966341 RepID=UPI002732AF5F|nr:hypothetical protein [Phreatobacter sp.]MDP2803675.1 hypothetical protein [Phreatobacter sp.]
MRALLPDAPNPNGWPYRLMVAPDGFYGRYGDAHEAGLITHVISIMPPGGHHFRFAELLQNRAKVWLPSREGQSLSQVVDDELAYVEHFVDALPADAGVLILSLNLGTPALAVAVGLIARQVGWQRAEEIEQELKATLPVSRVTPAAVLIAAWRRRPVASVDAAC